MPANDMLIYPKEDGHIDMTDGFVDAPVGLSIEVIEDAVSRITVLHLDVALGGSVDTPFSVGIPLNDMEVAALASRLQNILTLRSTLNRDRMN